MSDKKDSLSEIERNFTLRPYQQEMIDWLMSENKTIMLVGCDLGRAVILGYDEAGDITAEQIEYVKRHDFFVHRDELIDQPSPLAKQIKYEQMIGRGKRSSIEDEAAMLKELDPEPNGERIDRERFNYIRKHNHHPKRYKK